MRMAIHADDPPIKPPNAVTVAMKATRDVKSWRSESSPAANDMRIRTSSMTITDRRT
jgi:D-mannonate dehydratase